MQVDLRQEDENTPRKRCACCGEERYISTFSRDANESDGISILCLICAALDVKHLIARVEQRMVLTVRSLRPGRKAPDSETKLERCMRRYRAQGGKRCTECQHLRPPTATYFHVNNIKPDKLQTTCRTCISLRSKLGPGWPATRDALRATAPAKAPIA
jgi:hypothetical protein